MKYSLILLIVLAACQAKTEKSDTVIDSVTSISEYPVSELTTEGSIKRTITDFNCFILPPAEVYPDSVISSEVFPEIQEPITATILTQTKKMYGYSSKDDICEVFPLFKLNYSADQSGWVHGSHVFRIDPQSTKTVTFQNTGYEINLAISTGIGVSTEEGSTGCKELQLLYLTNRSNNQIQLVTSRSNLPNLKLLGITDQQWFSYTSDEGMSVTIKSAMESDNKIEIYHLIELQEGSREATMYLTKEANGFVIEKIEATPSK